MNTPWAQEEEIIDQNANYVLGMYDMYQNDKEIIAMLKMKGLNDGIVQKVLLKIKEPAYRKRIKQAKRIILFASLQLLALVVMPYIALIFSNNSTGVFIDPDNNIKYDLEREGMIFFYFKMLLRLALYVIVLALIQFVYGFYSLFKYNRLLKLSQ